MFLLAVGYGETQPIYVPVAAQTTHTSKNEAPEQIIYPILLIYWSFAFQQMQPQSHAKPSLLLF